MIGNIKNNLIFRMLDLLIRYDNDGSERRDWEVLS